MRSPRECVQVEKRRVRFSRADGEDEDDPAKVIRRSGQREGKKT